MNTHKSHGGSRPGSGAKKKYGEATAVISIRVPLSKRIAIRRKIKEWLKEYQNQFNNQVD